MKNSRQRYYDYFSGFYDRFVSLHSRTSPQDGMKAFLVDLLHSEGCGHVLDVCCGTGSFLLRLAEQTGPQPLLAVGLDFSKGMLAVSKRKTVMHPAVCLVRGDAAVLPFRSHSFDAVTCTHAFYELKSAVQDRALGEIVRILRPGSIFLMVEHDLPENAFVRALYYIRIASMGAARAVSILRNEKATLEHYFKSVAKIGAPAGKSKILLCRT